MNKITIPVQNTNDISDGCHTFGELYDHRITLFIALCKQIDNQPYAESKYKVWRSKKHCDNELCFDGTWFIMGIGTRKGEQITYHIPVGRWNETEFAETLQKAPEYDNHTAEVVIKRLKML